MDFNLHYVKAIYGPDGPKAQKGVPLSNQIAVAGYIAMRVVDWGSGDNGWAGIGTIADALGMSPKTTGNAISALEKQGWLDIKVRRNRPSIYKLTIPTVTQPLLTGVKSTEQNLPADVKSTEQPLPTDVNLVAGSVNFAPRSVTVTDDLYKPIKNLEEDAQEGAAATNTPQQVEEDKEQPLVEKVKIDPAALDGIITDLFERYNRPLVSGLSEGLRQRLRTSGLTNDQIPVYIEDRLMEFALTDLSDRQVFSYIRDDSAKWLKQQTPEQFCSAQEEELYRKMKRELRELEELERSLPPRKPMTQEEIDASNPFLLHFADPEGFAASRQGVK